MSTSENPAPQNAADFPVNALEEALAQALKESEAQGSAEDSGVDRATASRFLAALGEGELWVPLPEGSGTQEDGSIALPTLELAGERFVPVFTSVEQFSVHSAELPYAVVPTRELAAALPEGVGLALNPGNDASVPVYPSTLDLLRPDTDTEEA